MVDTAWIPDETLSTEALMVTVGELSYWPQRFLQHGRLAHLWWQFLAWWQSLQSGRIHNLQFSPFLGNHLADLAPQVEASACISRIIIPFPLHPSTSNTRRHTAGTSDASSKQ